ncbi:hypothetical protein JCM11641_001465 [Rhodosporidiobolus odoratus]
MPDLKVSYTICLPSDHTAATTELSTSSFSLPLDSSSPAAHLQSLEAALGEARAQMNQRLTVWKEELKVEEKKKEKEGRKRAIEGDEEEEEEEE